MRLIVAEDNQWARTILVRLLVKAGYDVTEAEDGQEALESFESQRKSQRPYQLIVTDLDMPRLNGQELIQKVRAYDKNFPFLVLSGQAEEELREALVEFPGIDFLPKPVKRSQVLEKITTLITEPFEEEGDAIEGLLHIKMKDFQGDKDFDRLVRKLRKSANGNCKIFLFDFNEVEKVTVKSIALLYALAEQLCTEASGIQLQILNANKEYEELFLLLGHGRYYSFF